MALLSNLQILAISQRNQDLSTDTVDAAELQIQQSEAQVLPLKICGAMCA